MYWWSFTLYDYIRFILLHLNHYINFINISMLTKVWSINGPNFCLTILNASQETTIPPPQIRMAQNLPIIFVSHFPSLQVEMCFQFICPTFLHVGGKFSNKFLHSNFVPFQVGICVTQLHIFMGKISNTNLIL